MPSLQEEKVPAKVKAPPAAKPSGKPRPIVYAERQSKLCIGADVLSEATAKKILKWETEKEFAAREMAKNKELTEEACAKIFRDPDEYGAPAFILKDEENNWVRCWMNWGNRPFDDTHMRGLAQTILTRRWADSRNGKDMTDNGESLILSQTGRVDSGQHRLIAVPIACQLRRKNPKRWNLWTEADPPSIECLISVGVSENPLVTETLDNVKPRTVADNLMTSAHFVNLNSGERRECTRMLEKAIAFAWKRSGAQGYMTNQACLEFLKLHPTLEVLVRHLFDENKNRGISLLRLSPGQMAGVAWLMATSASDLDAYQNANPPSEKKMDLSRLDLAQDFFVMLSSSPPAKQVKAVHHAIGGMVGDDAEGLGGRQFEKLAVLGKAWAILAADPKAIITEADVALKYWDDALGVKHLLAGDDGYLNYFGGVDLGEKAKKTSSEDGKEGQSGIEAPDPTPAEMEKRKTDAKAKTRAEQAQKIIDARKKNPPVPKQQPAPKLLPTPANKRPGVTPSGKK